MYIDLDTVITGPLDDALVGYCGTFATLATDGMLNEQRTLSEHAGRTLCTHRPRRKRGAVAGAAASPTTATKSRKTSP